MIRIPFVSGAVALGLVAASTLIPSAPASHKGSYEITITNVTRGQIMSPFVVATHDRRMTPVFTLGKPASNELVMLAEDGVPGPLMQQLKGNGHVRDVAVVTGKNGPILPGETVKVRLRAGDSLSLFSMLVTTNDAFAALNGVSLDRSELKGGITFHAPAYDAGSEANNEMGAYIPGPPFGNAHKRATAGAEGYVHIHAGIHGIADVVPAKYDWRNPVAVVTVQRVKR